MHACRSSYVTKSLRQLLKPMRREWFSISEIVAKFVGTIEIFPKIEVQE